MTRICIWTSVLGIIGGVEVWPNLTLHLRHLQSKKVFFLSQKYYFLRNSATRSPYNLFSILHKKMSPPRQLFENMQGLNPTHLPIATIRQVQEELPGRGNGNSS